MPVRGIIGAIDPVSIELPRLAVLQIDVPDVVCPLRELDPLRLFFALSFVEKAKFNAFRIMGIQSEIDTFSVPERA